MTTDRYDGVSDQILKPAGRFGLCCAIARTLPCPSSGRAGWLGA